MGFRSWWNSGPAEAAMREAGMEIMRRAAEFMAEKARELCPVDTGLLKSSIDVIAPSGSTSCHVVAMADYAQWVEFGHMAGSTWVAPQPFMRDALAMTVNAFQSFAGNTRIGRPGDDGGFLGTTFNAVP